MLLAETKSLEQALDEAFHKADDLDPESTYDQLVARIQANSADVLVPAVGDKLPEFLMTDSKTKWWVSLRCSSRAQW